MCAEFISSVGRSITDVATKSGAAQNETGLCATGNGVRVRPRFSSRTKMAA